MKINKNVNVILDILYIIVLKLFNSYDNMKYKLLIN